MSAPVRLCHPCKAENVRTVAVQRARVEGKITNVCERHHAALTVVRSRISGQGVEARQAVEGVIFDAPTVDTLAAALPDLQAAHAAAWQYVTPEVLATIRAYARRTQHVDTQRENLADDMLDAYVTRIGDRLARGEDVDAAGILRSVWGSHTSTRRNLQDARWDGPCDAPGYTFGQAFGDTAGHPERQAQAWKVGALTVSAQDMRDLIAANPEAAARYGVDMRDHVAA